MCSLNCKGRCCHISLIGLESLLCTYYNRTTWYVIDFYPSTDSTAQEQSSLSPLHPPTPQMSTPQGDPTSMPHSDPTSTPHGDPTSTPHGDPTYATRWVFLCCYYWWYIIITCITAYLYMYMWSCHNYYKVDTLLIQVECCHGLFINTPL